MLQKKCFSHLGLVEAQPFLRMALKTYLSQCAGVVSCHSAASWQELLATHSAADLDLLVLSQSEISAQALKALRAQWPGPLLLLTTRETLEPAEWAVEVQGLLSQARGYQYLQAALEALQQSQLYRWDHAEPAADHTKADGIALTPREREVAQALEAGQSLEAIALQMGLKKETVRRYQKRIEAKKIQVQNL